VTWRKNESESKYSRKYEKIGSERERERERESLREREKRGRERREERAGTTVQLRVLGAHPRRRKPALYYCWIIKLVSVRICANTSRYERGE
jgi:hypothetical protein